MKNPSPDHPIKTTADQSRERLSDPRIWMGLKAELGLSPRELDVAIRLAVGDSISQIAARLRISKYTIISYQTRIKRKTHAHHRGDLITKLWLASGLLLGE